MRLNEAEGEVKLDGLVENKLTEMLFLRRREVYEGSLMDFVRDSWPYIDSSEFQSNWALEGLCEHLEAVTLGQITRLLSNFPPRCSKTSIASICWPAWTWARSETSFTSGSRVRFLCASYDAPLALMAANKMRRLLLSPFYQKFWGGRFMLSWDQQNKGHFDNTMGGSRISVSVRGGLLGLGGDVVNIDDPHNTETEKMVESDADRKRVESWWREVSTTRLNDQKKSAIVLTMQRLHVGDLSGIILNENRGEWVQYIIPMRFDERRRCVTVILPRDQDDESAEPWSDPRTEDGELMWPERFDEEALTRMETSMGPFMAAGRLQQSPTPKRGGIIKRDFWQPWDQEEARSYGLEWDPRPGKLKEFPQCELIVGSLDTATGLKEENDYSAMTVFGVWLDKAKNRRAMLMYAWAKRLLLHGRPIEAYQGEAKVNFRQRQEAEWGLIEWVADTCRRYKVRRLLIENKNRGTDVAQEIERLYAREKWGVELIVPVKDKVSRAHSVVPLFTDGTVWAPDTRWADACLDQCALFPKDVHDDYVDTVTQFLLWARENGILLRGDEMSAAIADEAAFHHRHDTIGQMYGVG